MAVPIFEDFLYPFLLQLKDKDVSSKDMKAALIEYFKLTPAECELKTKGGNTTLVSDRLNWTRQYLRRALFVDIPQRGLYRITQRGKDYLKTHTDLRKADLMQYKEFAEYATGNTLPTPITPSPGVKPSPSELTPTDQLEQAFQSIKNDLAADILQKTLEQTPTFFEQMVVDLLVKMGYGGNFANSAEVTPISHDDGIDGIIYEDKLGLDKIYIQAKRYKPEITVGKPLIQQFSGALDEKKASKGVFITTSTYSKEAREYVKNLNKKIVLIDGTELANYLIEYNVGVNLKKVYEVKRIDLDYFED